MAHAVDQLRLVTINTSKDLRGNDTRRQPIICAHTETLKHDVASHTNLSLIIIVQFDHPVRAFDDLHARLACRRLERDVGQLVDRNSRSDFEEQRGLVLHWHESLAHRLQKTRELWLQRVEDHISAQLHKAATVPVVSRACQ